MHWYDFLAAAVFVAAAVYVAFRAYSALFARRTSACAAGCGSCPQSDARRPQTKDLLSIDAPPRES
jgi:hypothetical protein